MSRGDGAERILELGVGTGETARRVLARHVAWRERDLAVRLALA